MTVVTQVIFIIIIIIVRWQAISSSCLSYLAHLKSLGGATLIVRVVTLAIVFIIITTATTIAVASSAWTESPEDCNRFSATQAPDGGRETTRGATLIVSILSSPSSSSSSSFSYIYIPSVTFGIAGGARGYVAFYYLRHHHRHHHRRAPVASR